MAHVTNGSDNHESLDETDKAIIRHLQHDGRMSYAALSPLVGLSEAATRQRVNRLIDHGVMQVVAVTDPATVGLGLQAMVGITTVGDVRGIADALAEIEAVDYVVIVAGRYDIVIEVVANSSDDLLDLINGAIRPIEGVDRTEILTYLKLVKQTYTWGTA